MKQLKTKLQLSPGSCNQPERLTCSWGREVWVMWGLQAQRSRIWRWRYVGCRGIKRWRIGVESTWRAQTDKQIRLTTLNLVLSLGEDFITAATLRRRVGVGVPRWRSSRVHPIGRGRRASIGPVSHVGAPTKPRWDRLTSGHLKTQNKRTKMIKKQQEEYR